MAASLSYRPEQFEQPYYLALFKAADVSGRGILSGAEAVKFFGRSKLPVEVLKNVWTVADQPSTSSLDLKKFAVAVRLIQLTQNGQKGKGQHLETPSGVVLKPVFFEGVSGVTVPMPAPASQPQPQGMPPPHPTPQQQPNRAMPPQRAPTPTGPHQGSHPPSPKSSPRRGNHPPPQAPQSASPSRALVGMDPYTLSPQERQRYEGLFPSYAKTEADGSRFVYGSEAVPLFMKSGVDPNHLRDIWNMVDRNPVDNRLDKLEFALAMHLIVCLSKKNLPLPSGGQLPNSLHALKAGGNLAAAPPLPQQQQQQQQQMAPPPLQAEAAPPASGLAGPPALGAPGSGMGGMNISDAFEGMSVNESVPDYSQPEPEVPAAPAPTQSLPAYVPEAPIPTPELPTPQPQPAYVQPVPAAQPSQPPALQHVAPTPTYEVSDNHLDELNKLKSVLQQLQAENISLKAQLGNMTDEEKSVQQELGQTVTEITSLSTDLGRKRQEVLDAKNRLLEAKAELKAQKNTRGVLTGLIAESKETAEAIEGARETLRATTDAQQNVAPPAPRVPEADLFDMGYNNPVTGPPPPTTDDSSALLQPSQSLDGFANEHSLRDAQGMTGGVASLPVPPQQPAGDIEPMGNPQQQQLVPQPGDQQQQSYGNYTAPLEGGYPAPTPAPPQQEGYPAPAQVPPQQDAGGYPAPAPVPPQQEMGGYPGPAPVPPQQDAGGYPAPAPVPPQQEMGGYPAPAPMPPQQQQTPLQQNRQMVAPGHVRNTSGFDDGFLMGGSATSIPQDSSRDNDNFSVAARSMASTGDYGYDDQAYEIVENMKKKAKKADSAARDAEAAHRKLAAEADELRTDADRAEATARSLAAAPDDKGKKKGRFGGGASSKKKKKAKGEADQAKKDAALIKSHFMAIQSQALEAQTVAAQTRAEADRLRDEAEAAELDMAAAASKKQKQPAPAAAAPAQRQAPAGYNAVSPVPEYGAPPPQQQPPQGMAPQYGMPNGGAPMMPPNGGGYNNYMSGMGGGDMYGQQHQQYQQPSYQAYGASPQMSLHDPSKAAPGAIGNNANGGYGTPSPAMMGQLAGGDPYANPY